MSPLFRKEKSSKNKPPVSESTDIYGQSSQSSGNLGWIAENEIAINPGLYALFIYPIKPSPIPEVIRFRPINIIGKVGIITDPPIPNP